MPATISFYNEDTDYLLKQKLLIRGWLTKVIANESFKTGNISIILTRDEYLGKMNKDYLQHDTLTDIITFDYSADGIIAGDLFISVDRVRENAAVYSRNVAEELHRVIVHGVLHLCGYADKKPSEKKTMTRKEDHYLSLRPDRLRDAG
ncbi:MAG: rRNA maturation RNase YbeY [Clostridia bacterium]|nr:rRNA maturation RNase YbeY [Clostridia bacterium]